VNLTQSAVLRALQLAKVLDVEHTPEELHAAFRAVRHELETLRGLHVPEAPIPTSAPELKSAHTGRGTQPGSQRHHILGVLAVAAQADFQVANHLRIDVQVIRRRRHELVAAGWVERVQTDTGVQKVHQADTRRDCTVYQITDAGITALQRLRSGQTVLFSDAELGNELVTTPDKSKGCDVSPTYNPMPTTQSAVPLERASWATT
jgi:hypothetical protein